jgi:hypothetical protein
MASCLLSTITYNSSRGNQIDSFSRTCRSESYRKNPNKIMPQRGKRVHGVLANDLGRLSTASLTTFKFLFIGLYNLQPNLTYFASL